MADQIIITFSAPPEIKDLLKRWAKESDLNVSQLMRHIIRQEAQRREQPVSREKDKRQ